MDPPALGIKSYGVLQLPIKRKQERVHLDPALASRLEPIQFKAGLSASTLTGKLDARDNKYTLKVFQMPSNFLNLYSETKYYDFNFNYVSKKLLRSLVKRRVVLCIVHQSACFRAILGA